jgi:hypothetical protein
MNISMGILKDASMRCIGGVMVAGSKNSFPGIVLEGNLTEKGSIGCDPVPAICEGVVLMPLATDPEPSNPAVSEAF